LDPRHNSLISFDSPPIVEVAISVQFDPPKGINLAYLGAFWYKHQSSMPGVKTTQPIPMANESFGTELPWIPPSLQLALTNEPDCRLQMTCPDDQWMWQVQRNRFVVNWRKRSDDYPRFKETWNQFEETWIKWLNFLEEVKLPLPVPHLWELTYVNRIPRGGLWQNTQDWPTIFPGLWGGEIASLPGTDLRGCHGQWVWESTQPPARLYIEPRPGRSNDAANQEVLLLNLTARGACEPNSDPTNPSLNKVQAEMEFGHQWIVAAFDKIASGTAKQEWKRNDNIT